MKQKLEEIPQSAQTPTERNMVKAYTFEGIYSHGFAPESRTGVHEGKIVRFSDDMLVGLIGDRDAGIGTPITNNYFLGLFAGEDIAMINIPPAEELTYAVSWVFKKDNERAAIQDEYVGKWVLEYLPASLQLSMVPNLQALTRYNTSSLKRILSERARETIFNQGRLLGQSGRSKLNEANLDEVRKELGL